MITERSALQDGFETMTRGFKDSQLTAPEVFMKSLTGRVLFVTSTHLADALAPAVNDLVATLPHPRWRTVLNMRFGLETGTPKSLGAVGNELGVTQKQVRKLEDKAFARLRDGFITKSDAVFDDLAPFLAMDWHTLGAMAGLAETRGLFYLSRLDESVQLSSEAVNVLLGPSANLGEGGVDVASLAQIAAPKSLHESHPKIVEEAYGKLRDAFERILPALPRLGQRNFNMTYYDNYLVSTLYSGPTI